MYENEFKKLISTNKIPSAFMLYGACRLSVFLNLQILINLMKCDEKLVLRDSEFKTEKAKSFLSETSLFSSSKLLVLELEKAISTKELKELLSINLDENKLIIAINESKALKDLEKAMNGNSVRFFEKKATYEQLNLIKDCARFYNVNLDENAALLLQKTYEFDIFKAGCELLKYANSSLDLTTLKEHLDGDNALSFDDFFTNFINNNDINTFISKVVQNEDEIAIINKLNSTLLRLFTISTYLKENGRIDYKIAFGYTPPPQVCKELEHNARVFSDKFEQSFALILEAEYELKFNSNNNSKEIIYSYLLKLYFLLNS